MRTALTALYLLCATLCAAQRTSSIVEQGSVDGSRTEVQGRTPGIVLYPNPTSGDLYVRWGEVSLSRMPVEVRTLQGELLIMDSLSPQNGIDVSALPEGSYMLLLLDLRGVRAQQIFRVER